MMLRTRDKSYRAKICDIFHRMFYGVQVLYTTNQQLHLYSGIFKDPLDTERKIFKKKTEFINVMFHV